MSSCVGGAVRRTRWAADAGTEVCNGMGNADGPSAGHALGQIVQNEMDAREGRERPRRGRGGHGCRDAGWGSFTPRLLSGNQVGLRLVAAQTAASVRRAMLGN